MKQPFLLGLTGFLFLLFSCKQNTDLQKDVGEIFGTTYGIIYNYDSSLKDEFEGIFEKVNHSLSTYHKGSIISKINRNEKVKIDSLLEIVFKESKTIHKQTHGYFDLTVGPLFSAYGIGKEKLNILSKKEVDSLLSFTGMDKVSISKGDVLKKDPRVQLNVNAIAKGFALDLIADYLDTKGIENYLIEIGGEIVAKGKKAENKKWKIAIDDPTLDIHERNPQLKIELLNEAMATSGNYRKFKIDSITGKKYVHTLNPITGSAEPSDLLSVSVLAKDCLTADAYATAFMAMGKTKSLEVLKEQTNLKALLIFEDTKGGVLYEPINGFSLLKQE